MLLAARTAPSSKSLIARRHTALRTRASLASCLASAPRRTGAPASRAMAEASLSHRPRGSPARAVGSGDGTVAFVDGGETIADKCLRDPIMKRKLEEIRAAAKDDRIVVSDVLGEPVTTSDGSKVQSQFVDLVMAGGGMLGISHVGYVHAMEEAGVRFRGVAGTSAGAIATILVGAIRKNPLDVCGLALLEELSNMPAATFVDPPLDVKLLLDILNNIRDGVQPKDLKSLWGLITSGKIVGLLNIRAAVGEVIKDAGVCKGDAFQTWMERVLQTHLETAAPTMRDIKARCDMQALKLARRGAAPAEGGEGLRPLAVEEGVDPEGLVVVVAADVTTQTKAALTWARGDGNGADPATGKELRPRTQAELYFDSPDDVSPALLARMSMSVPIFFEPVTLPRETGKKLPKAGASGGDIPRWKKEGFTDAIPDKATFVDGGLLSNFPIQLFHVKPDPTRDIVMPTFGVLLDKQRKELDINDMQDLLNGIWTTSTKYGDVTFFDENPDYKWLVYTVKTPPGVNWLNFDMQDDQKVALFRAGVEAAHSFLLTSPSVNGAQGFNWEGYKKVRRSLADLETRQSW